MSLPLSSAEERRSEGAAVPLPELARGGFTAEPPGLGGHDQKHQAEHRQQQGGQKRPSGGSLPVSLTLRTSLSQFRHETVQCMFPAQEALLKRYLTAFIHAQFHQTKIRGHKLEI